MADRPRMTYLSQNRSVHRVVLSNGMVVIVTENPAADIVAARILVRAGGRYETPKQAGIANLLSAVLTKGTERLSSQDIAEKVESLGANLGSDAASDYCLLGFKAVSADFVDLLTIAAEILRSPTFPEAEVELERRLAIQGIRSMQEQPFTIAYQQLRQALYGSHPYAMSGIGTEETVGQLTRDDLVAFYQHYYRPDQMVVSLAGRLRAEEAIAQVEKAFGDWRSPTDQAVVAQIDASDAPAAEVPDRVITVQDTQQVIVMLGHLAASVHQSDYVPLKLISTYLGNGLSSRLFVELREKRGLAYDVSAIYPTRVDWSHFITYMGTAPENVAIAIDGLRHEVMQVCTQALSAEDLQIAKNKLLGQYALGKQTNGQIAQLLGWYEILGLGPQFDETFQQDVAAVSPETVQAIAQRYLATRPCISLVGPKDAVT
ncbi:MAG: pitrilysin family protein [Synechococcales bacterium]|nr:pitrilysin family protein [Synechococcales bacterium]